LSGPAGSFQSHPDSATYPQSQYCSWLITIAETYVVSLNFKELTIPSCNDMFLKIYDGANDTAPLLGTYCGSNATIEVDILSSANHLHVVSNSGGYGTNPRSSFSFDVQYNAEHASG
jgi:cubilin